MDGRLTPIISQSSRSTRRWPGFSVPDMIASRSFCATIERTVGTASIRSVECSSPRFSIVYRPDTGIGSIAIYGQNHHLRNLIMRRLVQCEVHQHAIEQRLRDRTAHAVGGAGQDDILARDISH